jgi:hypothetical protein
MKNAECTMKERTRKALCPQITQRNADEELFFSLRNCLNRETRETREKSRLAPGARGVRVFGVFRGLPGFPYWHGF